MKYMSSEFKSIQLNSKSNIAERVCPCIGKNHNKHLLYQAWTARSKFWYISSQLKNINIEIDAMYIQK